MSMPLNDMVEKYMYSIVKIAEVETIQEYSKWEKLIPFIKFPKDWEVKMIPPFGGAIVRFVVKRGENFVSVYLDCYDRLGCYGKPYWEIYPCKPDTYRCDMNDIEDLLDAIDYGLKNHRVSLKNLTEI
jgi:hypothetical protein